MHRSLLWIITWYNFYHKCIHVKWTSKFILTWYCCSREISRCIGCHGGSEGRLGYEAKGQHSSLTSPGTQLHSNRITLREKYPVDLMTTQKVYIPRQNSRVHCDTRENNLCSWATVFSVCSYGGRSYKWIMIVRIIIGLRCWEYKTCDRNGCMQNR